MLSGTLVLLLLNGTVALTLLAVGPALTSSVTLLGGEDVHAALVAV